jgi:nicotinamide phosphoribosyltransferase
MIRKNFTFKTDSYKFGGHWNMLPEGTQRVYSYGESRTGSEYNATVQHGMQATLIKYLCGVVVEQWMIDQAVAVSGHHLGNEEAFNRAGWQLIVDEFGGKLPLEIKSAPEGFIIPVGEALFTVTDTDEKKRFEWLTNYIEGILMKTWYPTTVATRSYTILQNIRKYWKQTSDLPIEFADFLLHDFGYRSTSSEESSEIGGCAHLTSGKGTDTMVGMEHAVNYYGASWETVGFSVPATEHSIATAYGEEGELEYILTMMERYPNGILSLVADSFGIENLISNKLPEIKDQIIARWKNGNAPLNRVVFRPDSPRYKGDRPFEQVLWLHEELGRIFGFEINSKGYKVLHPSVGVIYGDSLSQQQIDEIYDELMCVGWSIEKHIVGQGGGLLQKMDRDTQRFAIKCSAQLRNDEWKIIKKKPSDVTKVSKGGRMKLFKEVYENGDWTYKTITEEHPLYHDVKDELVTIYKNGEMVTTFTFDEIRENIKRHANDEKFLVNRD